MVSSKILIFQRVNILINTVLMLYVVRTVAGKSLLIRKCCRESQYLVLENGERKCVGEESNVTRRYVNNVRILDNPDFPWWMDNNTQPISDKTLVPMRSLLADQEEEKYIEFGVHVPCNVSTTAVINSTYKSFNVLHNGTLVFRGYTGSEVNFPPNAYCADRVYNNKQYIYVYLLCPCLNNSCVQACCKHPYQVVKRQSCTGHYYCSDERNNMALPDHFRGKFYRESYMFYQCDVSRDYYVNDSTEVISWPMWHSPQLMTMHGFEELPGLHSERQCGTLAVESNRSYAYIQCRPDTVLDRPFYYLVCPIRAAVLLLVLLVFLIVPEIRNRVSRIIICHIICALTTDVFVIDYRYFGGYKRGLSAIRFFDWPVLSMATSLWINVLCYDLVETFRKLRVRESVKKCDVKFLLYSIYVWGFTVVIAVVGYYFRNAPYIKYYMSLLAEFYPGIVNCILLFYVIVLIALRQQETSDLNGQDNARHTSNGCCSRNRKLLVHINLLLLMGPPCIAIHLFDPLYVSFTSFELYITLLDIQELLRSITLLLFVLLKPEVLRRLTRNMGTLCNARQHRTITTLSVVVSVIKLKGNYICPKSGNSTQEKISSVREIENPTKDMDIYVPEVVNSIKERAMPVQEEMNDVQERTIFVRKVISPIEEGTKSVQEVVNSTKETEIPV